VRAVSTLGLLVVSLASVLALAEGVTRLLSPLQLGFQFDGEVFSSPAEFEIDSQRNRWGCHDVEHDLSQPADRILLLGDSYVDAHSVPLAATLGRRLAEYTQREVVACGMAGMGQREELNVLQKLGPDVAPSVVVTLMLLFNDVADNYPPLRSESRRQWKEMRRFRPGWVRFSADEAPFLLVRGSRLNQLVSHRAAGFLLRSPDEIPLDYFVYASEVDERWEEAWQATEELLLLTRDRAEALGARYVIVSASTPHGILGAAAGRQALLSTYPAMASRDWDLDLPDRRVAEIARADGIPFLALEPLLRSRQRETGQRLHWKYDGHWNEAGNDEAARAIAAFLRELP